MCLLFAMNHSQRYLLLFSLHKRIQSGKLRKDSKIRSGQSFSNKVINNLPCKFAPTNSTSTKVVIPMGSTLSNQLRGNPPINQCHLSNNINSTDTSFGRNFGLHHQAIHIITHIITPLLELHRYQRFHWWSWLVLSIWHSLPYFLCRRNHPLPAKKMAMVLPRFHPCLLKSGISLLHYHGRIPPDFSNRWIKIRRYP